MTTKSFNEYLTESAKQYNYRIKIVGDVDKDTIKRLKTELKRFDVTSFVGPKATPITKNILGFADVQNEKVNIIDVTFNYPASTEQFTEIAKHLGIGGNKVLVLNKDFDDSMAADEENKEKTDDDALLNKDYDSNKAAKKASKDYSQSYQNSDPVKNAAKTEYEIAGGTPPKAQTTNDLPQGTKSPLGS